MKKIIENFDQFDDELFVGELWWDIRPKGRKIGFSDFSALESSKSTCLNSEKNS